MSYRDPLVWMLLLLLCLVGAGCTDKRPGADTCTPCQIEGEFKFHEEKGKPVAIMGPSSRGFMWREYSDTGRPLTNCIPCKEATQDFELFVCFGQQTMEKKRMENLR